MTLTHLTPIAFAAGLAVLAATLFLLQRLRVRYRAVPVVTTLFWREVVEEARARELVKRFRHPLAYLFILSIAGLLWLAYANPARQPRDGGRNLLLLDGSATMTAPGAFARAVEQLTEDLRSLPPERTEVWFCGDTTRALLLPGEHAELLEPRLRQVEPEALPSRIEDELLARARTAGTTEMTARVYSVAPIAPEALDLLPESIQVVDVDLGYRLPAGNRSIAALGVAEAASGAWDRVDVLLEIIGGSRTDFTVRDGDASLTAKAEIATDGSRLRAHYRDVTAVGQTIRVSLSGEDPLSIDDEAAIALPNRPLLRVALSPSLKSVLAPVLAADPAVRIVSAPPIDVAVATAGEPTEAARAALVFVPMSAQEDAFVVHHDERDDGDVLARSFDALGLAEIDATSLATELQRPIVVRATRDGRRALTVWDDLLSDRYDFRDSRAFPMFIARAVRWLSDTQSFPNSFAATEPAGWDEVYQDGEGRTLDPVGARFVPPRAGAYSDENGVTHFASLLTTGDVPDGSTAGPSDAGETSRAWWQRLDLASWIALAAFGLLALEWSLFRSSRIP